MTNFTKTETLRRLRALANATRSAALQPRNAKVEVGLRNFPLAVPQVDDGTALYAEHDDLRDFYDLPDAAGLDDVKAHGALVHLYVTSPGPWGELIDTLIGWTGTPSDPPRLVG